MYAPWIGRAEWLQQYIPYGHSIVCLRNISINTLHKGDDDDDDSEQSKPVLRHHWEAPEVHRLERRANNSMTTENGLYMGAIHNGYYPKQTALLCIF
jgi:hypothetical protein